MAAMKRAAAMKAMKAGDSDKKGVFEIFTGKAGKIWFRLKAPNDEIILHSQGYKALASCKHGIESVKQNCKDPKMFEHVNSKTGKPYFNLRAKNKEIIGTSQMYAGHSGRNAGCKSVTRWAPDADVVDLTEGAEEKVSKRPAAQSSGEAPATKAAKESSEPKQIVLKIDGPCTLQVTGAEVSAKPAEKEEEAEEEDEDEESDEEEEKKPAAMKAMKSMKAMKAPAMKSMKAMKAMKAPAMKAMKAAASKAVFEIFKGKAGKIWFRLKAPNDEIILHSQGYKAKEGCTHGIESVKENCKDPKMFEHVNSKTGKPYFNLRAKNKEIIGTSQMYAGHSGRNAGCKSVARWAPGAKIVDLTK